MYLCVSVCVLGLEIGGCKTWRGLDPVSIIEGGVDATQEQHTAQSQPPSPVTGPVASFVYFSPRLT